MTDKYLKNRGYVMYKSKLSIEEESKIKHDLTVKPYIPKSMMKVTDEKTSLSLTDYNLTHFVPFDSPFLHYTCNIPFDCSVVYNACVFGNKKQLVIPN